MLLANFVTKVFHNNADPETNRWASDTIGRTIQHRANQSESEAASYSRGMNTGENRSWGTNSSTGTSYGGNGSGSHSSSSGSNRGGGDSWGRNRGASTSETRSGGYSETMDYEIEPGDFGRVLKTGGPANQNQVTGIWFQAGKTFNDSARNYLHVRFRQ